MEQVFLSNCLQVELFVSVLRILCGRLAYTQRNCLRDQPREPKPKIWRRPSEMLSVLVHARGLCTQISSTVNNYYAEWLKHNPDLGRESSPGRDLEHCVETIWVSRGDLVPGSSKFGSMFSNFHFKKSPIEISSILCYVNSISRYYLPFALIISSMTMYCKNRKVCTCDFDFLQVWFESQEEFMVMGQTHRKTNPHYQLFR